MAISFDVQGRKVYVRVSGDPSRAERIRASNKLKTYAALGYQFPQGPKVRRGKKCLRLERRDNVERELQIEELFGLEVLAEPQLKVLGPSRFIRYLPDWELLNWWRSEFIVETLDRRPLELPLGIDGRVRSFLIARHVRCLTGCTQSFLEKYAAEYPGLLKKPGQFGVPWAVDTVEFLRHLGDPKYPFLPPPWRPHGVFGRAA